ncbi:MAG TPA: glycerate kinase, partial [Acidimicrobiales bacterium]|nr:glycerate kinase [Acidimicrobiales bacterium]
DAVAPSGRILVGLGGSASTDGGWDAAWAVRRRGGLRGARLVGAYDVRIGFVDAARLFAPQKGATPEQVALLEERLREMVVGYRDDFGVDVESIPGSGSAGGFGAAIVALGGTLRSGYELVAEAVDLPAALAVADLVMTGEGALDGQSFLGKVVGGVVEDAAAAGVPVVVVAGRATEEAAAEARRRGIRVETLVGRFGEVAAMADPVGCLDAVVDDVLAVDDPVTG